MATQREVELKLCKESFLFFVCFVYRNSLGKEFNWYWFHKQIANVLLHIPAGGRYILNAPFRIGKTCVIQVYIAWRLLNDPASTFLYVTYDQDLAEDKTQDIRAIVKWIADYFNIDDLRMAQGRRSASRWRTNAGGYVYAKGSNKPITGYGCDTMLIIDDPNKPMDRVSPKILEKRNQVYSTSVRNRINEPSVPIFIIQQRVAKNDLSGFLLAGGSGEDWVHLDFAGIKDDGSALCPERFPLEEIEKYKSDPFVYNAQIMQRPLDDIGQFFSKNKIILAQGKPPLAGKQLLISVDASGKGDINSDYNAISVIATDGKDYWILEVVNIKADITQLLTRIRELRRRYGNNVPILLEAKANGLAAIQILRKEMNGILETTPKFDKLERASVIKYLFDSLNVQFCCGGLVWAEVLSQFCSFPHCPHDDIVDSVVQGITYLRNNHSILARRENGNNQAPLTRRTYGGDNNAYGNPMRGY